MESCAFLARNFSRCASRSIFMGLWRHFARGSNFWNLALFGSGYAGLGLWRGLSFLLLSGQDQGVQRAGGGAEMAFGQMQVDGGFFQIVMPWQQLNGSQISAILKQVRRETVAQGVGMDSILQASASGGLAAGVIDGLGGDRMIRPMVTAPGEQPLRRFALQPAPIVP